MKFIFLGTADFGIPALQRMVDEGHECCGVVTNPPKKSGRGLKVRKSPVHDYCDENEIGPVFTPESLKDTEFHTELASLKADVFIVVAFSILPEALFSIPPKGTYNIHAAQLPLFRGPAPIQRAIETGASESGVTLFRIDRGVDTGNILTQLSCEISNSDTTPSLYERLSLLGADALQQGLELLSSGNEVYKEQDHSLATKAPLLKKSEAQVDWSNSAETIYNKMRAFKPFPSCFTEWNGKRFGIEWGEYRETSKNAEAGTVISTSAEGIVISCGEGEFVITQIKPAGKRAMAVSDFINGSSLVEGTVLK